MPNHAISIFGGALLAGLAQSFTVYLLAVIMQLSVTDFSIFLGSLLTTGDAVWAGRLVWAVMAILWSMLFLVARQYLPGPPLQQGLLYGLSIWVLSTGILLPLLGTVVGTGIPHPGWFGLGFGGLPAAITSLLAHLSFGGVLGFYVGSLARV